MRDALKGLPKVQFTRPPMYLVYGKRVSIPDVACRSVNAARSLLVNAGFGVSVSSQRIYSKCAAGTVARTDPVGSTSKGGTVMIYVSDGTKSENSPSPPPSPIKREHGPGDGGVGVTR